MTKWWSLVLLLLATNWCLGNDLIIEVASKEKLSVRSGQVVNVSLILRNLSEDTVQVRPEITLPKGWKLISTFKTITINGGAAKPHLVSLLVPLKSIAGQYPVNYRLRDKKYVGLRATKDLTFTVQATQEVEVVPIEAPAMIMAGRKIKGRFLVKNISNQTQDIQLSAGKAKILDANKISLAPFSNQEVEVSISTYSETRQINLLGIYLTAQLSNKKSKHTAYLYTKVIPTKAFETNRVRQLPGYVGLNVLHRQFANGRTANGWQGELFLQGYLDTAKQKFVTLSLRGPSQQATTDLTLYDEYYAQYQSETFGVTVGDNNYTLSNLTEFARNGRGVSAEVRKGTATFGGFYVRPRFFEAIKDEIGLFVENQFNGQASFRFNYLKKNQVAPEQSASVLSISGAFQPFQKTFVEAEIASSNRGESAFLRVSSQPINRLRFDGTFIYASPDFAGFFQNTFNLITNANYRINKQLSLVGGINKDNRNAALDTLFLAAPIADRRQVGINVKLGRKTQFQLSLRQNEIEDRLPQKKFFRKENLWMANLNQRFGKFSFNGIVEYGKTQNLLQINENRQQELLRTFVNLSWRLNNWELSSFAQYFNQNSTLIESQKQLLWGGRITGRIGNNTKFSMRYQNDFAVEEYYQNRNALDFSLTQHIGRNHQITVNARQAIQRNTLNNRDVNISARYVYNFGIPLDEKPPQGSVIGFIERQNAAPAAGIVVYLDGKPATTNTQGQFRFKSVEPGNYPLMVDPSSLELHELLESPTAPMVEVTADMEELVTLKLIKSGTLIGQLQFETAPKGKLINQKPLSGLMVQISDGQETRRGFSDPHGQFIFKDLRPGQWKVEVFKDSANKRIQFVHSVFNLEIGAGERRELVVPIKERKRNIQFKRLMSLSDDG